MRSTVYTVARPAPLTAEVEDPLSDEDPTEGEGEYDGNGVGRESRETKLGAESGAGTKARLGLEWYSVLSTQVSVLELGAYCTEPLHCSVGSQNTQQRRRLRV